MNGVDRILPNVNVLLNVLVSLYCLFLRRIRPLLKCKKPFFYEHIRCPRGIFGIKKSLTRLYSPGFGFFTEVPNECKTSSNRYSRKLFPIVIVFRMAKKIDIDLVSLFIFLILWFYDLNVILFNL